MGCQVPLGPNYCFLSIILSLSDEHGYHLGRDLDRRGRVEGERGEGTTASPVCGYPSPTDCTICRTRAAHYRHRHGAPRHLHGARGDQGGVPRGASGVVEPESSEGAPGRRLLTRFMHERTRLTAERGVSARSAMLKRLDEPAGRRFAGTQRHQAPRHVGGVRGGAGRAVQLSAFLTAAGGSLSTALSSPSSPRRGCVRQRHEGLSPTTSTGTRAPCVSSGPSIQTTLRSPRRRMRRGTSTCRPSSRPPCGSISGGWTATP